MIKLFHVRRPDDGIQTLGDYYLKDGDQVIFACKTLELPFKGNKQNISCIPAGVYKVRKLSNSPNIPYPHFEIMNVAGRTGIKIHRITYVKDLLGCTGVGMSLADFNKDGVMDIAQSKVALDKLLELCPDNFEIEISYETQIT